MDIMKHLVDSQGLVLVMALFVIRFNLPIEFLAIDLTVKIQCTHRVTEGAGELVVHTIKEDPMTPLKLLWLFGFIILLDHFASVGR